MELSTPTVREWLLEWCADVRPGGVTQVRFFRSPQDAEGLCVVLAAGSAAALGAALQGPRGFACHFRDDAPDLQLALDFTSRSVAVDFNDESSDLRTVNARESEQREPQVRCDDWLGERKRRSRPGVEREAGAEPGETNL